MVAGIEQRRLFCELLNMENRFMAFNNDTTTKRAHYVNLMKSTKDFCGEHLSPISESDVIMLLSHKEILDGLNDKLNGTGFTLQINWSDDQGQNWRQYPQSK